MPENPYDKFFVTDGGAQNEPEKQGEKQGNTGKIDDFGEDRLENPDIPEVGEKVVLTDGTTEEVISVKREILLGYRKCLSCYAENDGNQKICLNCSKNRPLNVEFYLKEDSPVITNKDEIDEALSGPDRQCTVCSKINEFNSRICVECKTDQNLGGDTDKSLNAVYNDSDVKQRDEKLENREDVLPKDEKTRSVIASLLSKLPEGVSLKKIIWGSAIGLTILFGGNEIRLRFTTHAESARIESLKWKRTVNLEKLVPMQRDSRDSYPSGAYNIKKDRKVHHYNKVQTGTERYDDTEYSREKTGTKPVQKSERVKTGTKSVSYPETEYETEYYTETEYETRSLGNGSFERVAVQKQKSKRVPKTVTKTRYEDVYETKYYTEYEDVYENVPHKVRKQRPIYIDVPEYRDFYTYTIKEWVPGRSVTKQGSDNNPIRPNESDIHLGNEERVFGKDEDYDVCVFTSDGKKGCIDVPVNTFLNLSQDGTVQVSVNGKSQIIGLDQSH